MARCSRRSSCEIESPLRAADFRSAGTCTYAGMKIPSQDEAGVPGVIQVKVITAVDRTSPSAANDSYCGAKQLIPILAFCLFGCGAGAQSVGDSSDAAIQGRQLA